MEPESDFSQYKEFVQTPYDKSRIVWASVLDKQYGIEVKRKPEITHGGIFCIFDLDNDNKLLFTEDVVVSFGAPFGADIRDVMLWRVKAAEFVDVTLPSLKNVENIYHKDGTVAGVVISC